MLLHHAAFTYYATEPTYRWLTPLSGPADGGTPVTINAKNWPAPAASPHSGHGRCRFGHHHHAPTTALTFALMSRAAGRARRSAGETYLHCAAPPATNAHEAAASAAAATSAGRPPPVVVLPLLIAPNGVDFLPTNLTYRYEAPPSHEAAFLMSMGPALALCVGVAFVVHALRKLRDEIASSGWGGDTLAHWGAMRHASEEQRRQHRAMKSMRRGGSGGGGGGGGAGGRGALAPPGEGEDDDEDDDGGADVDRAAQQLRVAPVSRVVVRAPAELLQPLGCIAEEEHEGQDSPSPHV